MKIEIRDDHHYVDVSHEPEPKSVIEQFFASVHPEVDLTKSNIEFMDEENRKNELDEVYRKSQAFDTLLHTYERYRHSHAHDLKLLLGMKAIELLEADE